MAACGLLAAGWLAGSIVPIPVLQKNPYVKFIGAWMDENIWFPHEWSTARALSSALQARAAEALLQKGPLLSGLWAAAPMAAIGAYAVKRPPAARAKI